MKKTLAIVLALCMMLGILAACSSKSSTTTSTGDNTNTQQQTIASAGKDPVVTDVVETGNGNVSGKDGKRTFLSFGAGTAQELSPFTSSSAGNMTFRTIIYTQLAYDDGNGWLASDAAESIEMADSEGFQWRIKLYAGIKDSDGNPFTADDLVFTMNKIKEIGRISYYSVFDNVVKEDDLTVLLTLKSNLNTALIDLCNNTLLVTEKAYTESPDEMKTTPVGTTQYKLTEVVPSSYAQFEKIDNYWQTDASKITRAAEANVDVIRITMLKETSAKLSGLQQGTLQLANNMTYLNTMGLDTNKFNIFEKKNTASCDNLVFNMTSTGLCANDINLRKAILYAIDSNAILAALGGKGEALKSEITTDYIDYNPEWLNEDYWTYNPDLAKEYLAKSNYKGETVRLLNSTDQTVQTRNEVIISELTAIGIKAELVTLESNVYQQNQYASSGSYDICAIGVGANDYLYSDAAAKIGSDTTSDVPGTTKYGWDNAEFIALCNEVGKIQTTNKAELNEKIHDMAYENAVIKGLASSSQYNIGVKGIESLMVTRTYIRAGATHFSADYDVFYEG